MNDMHRQLAGRASKRYELASPHCLAFRSKTAAYHIVGESSVVRHGKMGPLISLKGQTANSRVVLAESVYPSISDITLQPREGRKGPNADNRKVLFDHLVGECEQVWR